MSGFRTGCVALISACLILMGGCATGNGVNKSDAAEANANLGANFLRRNDLDKAQRYFDKALNYDRSNFNANWGMAEVNARLDNPDEASRYFRKALDLKSRPELFNSYAVFLCRRHQTAKALKYFKRAAADPEYDHNANALANAGLCLDKAGDSDKAAAYFRKALAKNPSQLTALSRMARLEYARGNYLNARAFIERASADTTLDAGLLLLGARVELALGDRDAARSYLKRHNAERPSQTRSLQQLESSTDE